MLDLETLGTKPGSVILEIGAVLFWPDDPKRPSVGRKWRICPASCVEKGLAVDVDTVLWWLEQPAAAQVAVLVTKEEERRPLGEALEELEQWAGNSSVQFVWGKGPTFDLAHLAAAYRAVGCSPWWKFWQERCVRTIYDLRPEGFKWTEPMVAHDSLCDAVAQADNVAAIWRLLKRAGQIPEVGQPKAKLTHELLGVSFAPHAPSAGWAWKYAHLGLATVVPMQTPVTALPHPSSPIPSPHV